MHKSTKNLCYAAMFLALGLVLPFLTGLVLPLLRNLLFGMPPLFPTGAAMTCELAAYGFVAGWLYSHSRWQCVVALYRCLLAAMLAGRLVWGAAQVCLLGVGAAGFTWQMFLAGALLNAIPGIILQLILLPGVMLALHRTGLVPFMKNGRPVPATERCI